jgi:hypothetical protein
VQRRVGEVGLRVRDTVLSLAALLKLASAPGIVTLALLDALVVCIALFVWSALTRRAAIRWLTDLIAESANRSVFGSSIANIDNRAYKEAVNSA